MTDTNCWLAYKRRGKPMEAPLNDSNLQTTPDFSRNAYVSIRFPSVFKNGWYWTSALRRWCDSSGIAYLSEDGGTLISADVTKQQIEAFIAYVYEFDPDFCDPSADPLRPERLLELADLKADVGKDLDPNAVHQLRADEW